jgi:hypothetical protein
MNHPDHEIEMARSELYSIAKYAMALHEMLENVSELEGMEGWQQSKITKAADYMESVYQSLSHEMKFDEAAPKGWEGTVKAMKKHKEIDNPWALAHYMKNKGYKSHKKEEGVAEANLSELNKDTVYSYAKKADKDQDKQSTITGKAYLDNDPKTANKAHHKFSMRAAGLDRAEKRLNKEGVAEGPNDGKEDNFTIDDIKRLEQIRDFETLKAQAKELIKGKPARRMKPEKISWFYNHIDTLRSPLAVIKMMYDLMLAGEGNKVIGSRNSMSSNSYRQRFGEQGELDESVAEAGRGSNKGYAPGFASPTAPPLRPVGGPKQSDEPDAVNNIEVSINGRPWKVFPGAGPDSSQAFFKQKKSVDDMCKRKTAETGKKWSWGVTGDPATNESVEENKKGVRAVKHTTKPRNPVMAGDKPGKATVTHKNKKKDAERGIEKHKGKEPAYESRLWNALSQHLEK